MFAELFILEWNALFWLMFFIAKLNGMRYTEPDLTYMAIYLMFIWIITSALMYKVGELLDNQYKDKKMKQGAKA